MDVKWIAPILVLIICLSYLALSEEGNPVYFNSITEESNLSPPQNSQIRRHWSDLLPQHNPYSYPMQRSPCPYSRGESFPLPPFSMRGSAHKFPTSTGSRGKFRHNTTPALDPIHGLLNFKYGFWDRVRGRLEGKFPVCSRRRRPERYRGNVNTRGNHWDLS